MKILHRFRQSFTDPLLRPAEIFRPEGHLARRIHVEKLRAWILEHTPNNRRRVIERLGTGVTPVHQDTARKHPLIIMRDQPVDETRQRRLATTRHPAEHHTFALGNLQIDPSHPSPAFRRAAVKETHIFKTDHSPQLLSSSTQKNHKAPHAERKSQHIPATEADVLRARAHHRRTKAAGERRS